MIRILIVEDHPAMRAGLTAVLRAEPGLVPLAATESVHDLPPALHRTRPDVVLLDYHLPSTNGLIVCRELKQMIPAPAVLLYSAYCDVSMVIPAALAGADGLLNKSAPASELYDAIRAVARRDPILPRVDREHLDRAANAVDPADVPILGMALENVPVSEIAATLRRPMPEILERIDRMLRRLSVEVPAVAR